MDVTLFFEGFDWDAYNEDKILGKHGIPRPDIEAALETRYRTLADTVHSGLEPRFLALGLDRKLRPLIVFFTLRHRDGRDLARPISARYMHAKEQRRYEDFESR